MKNKIPTLLFLLLAAGLFSTGCSTPVDVQGEYSTPTQTISGGVDVATNGTVITGQVEEK